MCTVDLDLLVAHSYMYAAVSPLFSLLPHYHKGLPYLLPYSVERVTKKLMSSVPISSSVELLQVQTSVTNVALEVHPSDQT